VEPELPILDAVDGRRFACFPAAVLGLIIDDRERFLLMARPDRGAWQLVAGALERDESPRDGLRREVAEEAGPSVRIDPIGVVHAFQYPYDPNVRSMLSIAYVARFRGGDIVPGSDMEGSAVGWFGLDEIVADDFESTMPELRWLARRALDMARWYPTVTDAELEPWVEPR
jgi:ADP-ribose pyrophosphatase YjhB (NUDIX family)